MVIGEVYSYKTKYIQINLLYGLNKQIKLIRVYKVMDEDKSIYVDNFIIYDVNMEYYKELWYTKDTKKVQDNILLVMLGLERNDLIELSKKNKLVSKYMEEVEKVNENPEFREYISYEEEQRKIRNEYKKEGYESGLEEGKILIVKNLLSEGMSITKISHIVQLPEERILQIKCND